MLLGFGEFRVLEARQIGAGEVELTVETVAEVAWCHGCGVRAHSKGRPTVVVRDVDAFDRGSCCLVDAALRRETVSQVSDTLSVVRRAEEERCFSERISEG